MFIAAPFTAAWKWNLTRFVTKHRYLQCGIIDNGILLIVKHELRLIVSSLESELWSLKVLNGLRKRYAEWGQLSPYNKCFMFSFIYIVYMNTLIVC